MVWSVHCHNDLGTAVANSLAGEDGGARVRERTITRQTVHSEEAGDGGQKHASDYFYPDPGTIRSKILRCSRVQLHHRFCRSPTKAAVGANAFSYASGIQCDD
jgi:2-isopropylmalate synthase